MASGWYAYDWGVGDVYCNYKCIDKKTGEYKIHSMLKMAHVCTKTGSYHVCKECFEERKYKYHQCCVCSEWRLNSEHNRYYRYDDNRTVCCACLMINSIGCTNELYKFLDIYEDGMEVTDEFKAFVKLNIEYAEFQKSIIEDKDKFKALLVIKWYFKHMNYGALFLFVNTLPQEIIKKLGEHKGKIMSGISKDTEIACILTGVDRSEMMKHPYARF